MDKNELHVRFTYHNPNESQVSRMAAIRISCGALASLISDSCPDSRELSLALTHLEQASMFANASIVRREP